MQDLIKQEQFELEVLDKLNSGRFLPHFVFGGGTALRLCFGLNRFSVDLDFWLVKNTDTKSLFKELKKYLASFYEIKDSADKFYTLLFELRSKVYPRSLKIEIRKEAKKVKTEQAIAYSPYSNTQVLLRVVTLEDMMKAKIETFLERKEIRDVFDMEFLIKKGISPEGSKDTFNKILTGIAAFTKKDYTAKLGSLLEEGQRKYYADNNFKVLISTIKEKCLESPGRDASAGTRGR
jgi:predicted nucleotidyltransferase component of viral defense system